MQTKNIEELLPHREPFLFADEIISVTKEEIIAVTTFDKGCEWLKGSFPEHHYIPGTILIESIAQCGGAGIRLLGIANGTFALTSLENVNFFKGAEYNKQIKYIIKNIKISEKIIKQSGIAYMDEQPIMEASWMSVKMPALK